MPLKYRNQRSKSSLNLSGDPRAESGLTERGGLVWPQAPLCGCLPDKGRPFGLGSGLAAGKKSVFYNFNLVGILDQVQQEALA